MMRDGDTQDEKDRMVHPVLRARGLDELVEISALCASTTTHIDRQAEKAPLLIEVGTTSERGRIQMKKGLGERDEMEARSLLE